MTWTNLSPMIRKLPDSNPVHNGPLRRALCLVAAVLCLTAAGAGSLRAEITAKSFIQTLGNTALLELSGDGLTPVQREEKFREMFHENFDVPRITRFALGRYARRVTKDEMTAFSGLYEDLAVLTYAHLFAAYGGQGLAVKKQLGGAGDKFVMVVSEIAAEEGAEPARLDWQVRVSDTGYSVVDIRVEGVSMAIAQRDEFTSVLDKNKGNMSVLLSELTVKVEKLRADRSGE